MPTQAEQSNKALVPEAVDTLFNKRDLGAAARFWSPGYIQHSAHIAPGREGLFALVQAAPDSLPIIGMSSRTKRPGPAPEAGCQCSARRFPPEPV